MKMYFGGIRRYWSAFVGTVVTLIAGLSLLSAAARAADDHHIISFDAPGADTTAGDFNGTFAAAINNWGAIAGSYADTVNVNHGFIRLPDGKFVTFQAPGADTTPGSFNGTVATAINDFGVVAGEYFDASGEGHGFLRSPDGKFTTFDVPG